MGDDLGHPLAAPAQPGPIRGEECGHVTRSPPITAHLSQTAWCGMQILSRVSVFSSSAASLLRRRRSSSCDTSTADMSAVFDDVWKPPPLVDTQIKLLLSTMGNSSSLP